MALELYIPPCIHNPRHPHHPPPPDKPLRIQIQGPLECVQKLLPNIEFYTKNFQYTFPQPAGPRLARLVLEKLYGQEVLEGIEDPVVVRDEYLAWASGKDKPIVE